MILLCLQRVHRPVLRRYFSSGLRHCYLESPLKQAATPGLTFTCRTVKGILSMCLHFYAGPHLRQTLWGGKRTAGCAQHVQCKRQCGRLNLHAESCPICTDERQYVRSTGQEWTTPSELGKTHKSVVKEEEPGLLGIGIEPPVGIGQRSLLIKTGAHFHLLVSGSFDLLVQWITC